MKALIHKTVVGWKAKPKLFWSLVITGLLLLMPSARAQFTWPVYEPFSEYTSRTNLGGADTLTNWNVGNGGSNGVTSYVVVNVAAMSFPALLSDSNPAPAGVMSEVVLNTSADRGFMFNSHTGAIYASFLLNYIDNGAATVTPVNRCIFNLVTGATSWTNGSFGAIYSSVWLTPDYRLIVDKNFQQGGTFTSPGPLLATNTPHLIVLCYQTNTVAGAPDTVKVWVDPTPFGNNGSIPPPTLSTTNGPNIASFNALMLNDRAVPAYTASAFYVDEIRVNDNWAGVTPLATPVPGPVFTVKGGGSSCGSPEDVFLSGSATTNAYLLYTNGVYTGYVTNGTGTAIDFGPQLALGYYSVLASNLATANVGWMSNSVTVAILQPPVIVTEPVPVVAATNNRAAFTAVVTGNNLTFQWYKDGTALTNDAHLTGATTNALVISPVTTADIGNYYAFILDGCGNTAYTTTNSLTLDAPNNLTWSGDGFNVDIWDIANSPEWNGGGSVFNPGDNVTFDDSYPYANNISLNGNLTPTSITVNAARNYTWVNGAQGGLISGATSLVKSGTGTLLVNNNASSYLNTFTGGTVINNGTVNISNSYSLLGTGPVTLAGGTLETFQKGNGTSTGLSNTLFVTANSTWQVDRTGTQCAGLLTPLIGSPGTTLTLYNSAATENSQNWFRFGGMFTNNSALAISVNPTPTNSPLYIASYNSTGAQVYNAPISGRSGFLVEGAGAVYLNAANIYPGPTTNALGFLAGSGSVSGLVSVVSGATLGAGSADAIGTFTTSSNLYLNGNVFIRVNKSLAQSNDQIVVSGIITNTGTGTVTITNIGAASLVVGDSFKIISGAVSNGAALTVTGGGANWLNNLAVNGSIQVQSVIPGYSTNISYSVTGSTLKITWPTTHLGWILQTRTNTLATGLLSTTNWVDIAGTANGTSNNFTIMPGNPSVFYRLRHP